MKKIIEKLLPLIEISSNSSWVKPLKRWHSELDQYYMEVIPEIIRGCGHHSSLTDLYIHKDGIILGEENDLLDKLTDELFNLCVEALPEIYSNKKPPKPDSDTEKTE